MSTLYTIDEWRIHFEPSPTGTTNKEFDVMSTKRIAVVLLAVVAGVTVCHAETPAAGLAITKLYVSPKGNDAHSGKRAEVSRLIAID